MKGEITLLGIAPIACVKFEFTLAHVRHTIAKDLHLIGHIGHSGRSQVQLQCIGIETFDLKTQRPNRLGTRSQFDDTFQHTQRIGHLAFVVPKLAGVAYLQLQRRSIVGHKDAMIEAHDALVVMQPGERRRWFPHSVATEVHTAPHIGILHRHRLVEEPIRRICNEGEREWEREEEKDKRAAQKITVKARMGKPLPDSPHI